MNRHQTIKHKLSAASVWIVAAGLFATACGSDASPSSDDPSDPSGKENGCEDGTTRTGDSSCGLNDRGRLEEICEDGNWVTGSSCEDADVCVDSKTRKSDKPC